MYDDDDDENFYGTLSVMPDIYSENYLMIFPLVSHHIFIFGCNSLFIYHTDNDAAVPTAT